MADLMNITTDQKGQLWLLQQPAGRPPPGVIPNFDNPSNLDAAVYSIIILSCSIAVLATMIRIYTKIFLIRLLVYEDYVLALASIMMIAQAIMICVGIVHAGHGIHVWNLHLDSVYAMLYWSDIYVIVYIPAVFLLRLSILLQYLRIFVPQRRNAMIMHDAIYALIACHFVFYLINFIVFIAVCDPREKLWKPHRIAFGLCLSWITGGHCNNPAAWFIASGIFNVVSDFAILILPIPCIWKLQLPKKKKVMVSAVFATGILACADSLFRTYYSFRLDRDPDVTYNSIIDVIGAHLELCVGTVVSCAPVLPRFFQQHGHQITGLFRLPQVSGMIKRSKHFRLPSNTQQTQQRDPLEDPAQTSPPRVPNYHGALTKQKSGGDPSLNAEDGLPLNQILPTNSLLMAVIRK